MLLTFLIKQQSNRFTEEQLTPVLAEVASMISDEDLQLCNLALGFCTAVVQCHSAAANLVSVQRSWLVCGCGTDCVVVMGRRSGLGHWSPSSPSQRARCCKAARWQRPWSSCAHCHS